MLNNRYGRIFMSALLVAVVAAVDTDYALRFGFFATYWACMELTGFGDELAAATARAINRC